MAGMASKVSAPKLPAGGLPVGFAVPTNQQVVLTQAGVFSGVALWALAQVRRRGVGWYREGGNDRMVQDVRAAKGQAMLGRMRQAAAVCLALRRECRQPDDTHLRAQCHGHCDAYKHAHGLRRFMSATTLFRPSRTSPPQAVLESQDAQLADTAGLQLSLALGYAVYSLRENKKMGLGGVGRFGHVLAERGGTRAQQLLGGLSRRR